jgi:hypothetical protein
LTTLLQNNVGSHATKPFEVEVEINTIGEDVVLMDIEPFELEKEVDSTVDDIVDNTAVDESGVTDTEEVKLNWVSVEPN